MGTPRLLATLTAVIAVGGLASCSRAADTTAAPPVVTTPAAELRLAYFPNITHAPR